MFRVADTCIIFSPLSMPFPRAVPLFSFGITPSLFHRLSCLFLFPLIILMFVRGTRFVLSNPWEEDERRRSTILNDISCSLTMHPADAEDPRLRNNTPSSCTILDEIVVIFVICHRLATARDEGIIILFPFVRTVRKLGGLILRLKQAVPTWRHRLCFVL